MRARVQKWGNSLAVRIPSAFAHEVRVDENSNVELSVRNGQLIITPLLAEDSLEHLLAGITDENLHGEFETGPAVGNEGW